MIRTRYETSPFSLYERNLKYVTSKCRINDTRSPPEEGRSKAKFTTVRLSREDIKYFSCRQEDVKYFSVVL